jgi:glycosyltransferase involved in cell wall biosynthesis
VPGDPQSNCNGWAGAEPFYVPLMKIVHVIASIDPAGGGPPQVAVRLAAAQAQLGHKVELVTYRADSAGEERTLSQLSGVPGFDGVAIHALRGPGRHERFFARQAEALLGDIVPSGQWLHLHGVWERMLHRAAAIACRHSVPYCIRPAGMLNPWSLKHKRWKKSLALNLGVRRIIDRANFIHCLNSDEAALVAPLGLRPPRLVFPNGVFLEEFARLPPTGTFISSRPALRGRRFILFLGRLHIVKGLDILAEAWRRCAAEAPDVDLVVAGPDAGAGEDFMARIAEGGLAHRVHLVGPLYGEAKFAALVDAACFCLPSRQEGFSVAVLEALACGVPAVISEACRFPEAAAAGAAEVVGPQAALLADGLMRVLSDPKRALAMGRAGRHLVKSQYTWPIIAKRVVCAYGEFAQKSASGAPLREP